MPNDNKLTITPAIITPIAINPNARQNGILKTTPAKAPVQAPVKGRGIATKEIKAKSPHLINL